MSKPVSWEDQRIFLAVLEDGSLSAAARRLGVSHPTVRSRIDALERALDTVLFTRSVNGLVPTETALALREPARAMAMASDLFVRQGSSVGTDVSGTVRISVPDVMGVEVIPRMLRTLRNDHPDLQIELSLSNLPADLLAQEVDIAVRTVTPTQKALIARKVASIPLGLFAAPDYLGQRGTPMTLSDLARHDFIGPDRNHRDLALAERLILAGRLGADLLRDRMVVRIDSHPAQVAGGRGLHRDARTRGRRPPRPSAARLRGRAAANLDRHARKPVKGATRPRGIRFSGGLLHALWRRAMIGHARGPTPFDPEKHRENQS